jgi:hypothetical protein
MLRSLLTRNISISGVERIAESRAYFREFLETAHGWVHFRTNETDKIAREEERELLILWLAADSDNAVGDFSDSVVQLDDEYEKEESVALKQALLGEVKERLAALAVKNLGVPNGLRELASYEKGAATLPLLFDPSGPIWGPTSSAGISSALGKAARDGNVQKNARAWLELAIDRHDGDPQKLQDFFRTDGPVADLWRAAVATPLQFRMICETRKLREMLIQCGVAGDALGVPAWLQQQSGD